MSASVLSGIVANSSNNRYLFSPSADFLLLGGGSLIVLLGFRLLLDDTSIAWSYATTLVLANFINHPHFAHSYQMFYRDFGRKITTYPLELRWRYRTAGLVVPAVLIFFFAFTVVFEMPKLLGFGANLMFFLVGWHYVKQGYGIAMVDAVLKKAFYNDEEKKCLLQNAYATWLVSWLLINYQLAAAGMENKYFEISYVVFPIPFWVLMFAATVCAYTSFRLIRIMWSRMAKGNKMAWNGLLAYTISLYVWLLIRDPLLIVWFPLFHSLQYLTVVWRYEINRAKTKPSRVRLSLRFALFSALGFTLGYLGFWALPEWLNANISYSKEIFGTSLFLYIFWIFINVHHYALDNVMWRKGNPDVQAHLFAH